MQTNQAVSVYKPGGNSAPEVFDFENEGTIADIKLNKLIILSDRCVDRALRFFGPTEV